MNAVRAWSLTICMAALIAALLQYLLPGGSMERMAKFVTGAFFLCVLIVPIANIAPQISSAFWQNTQTDPDTEFSSMVEGQIQDTAQQSIRNLIIAELEKIQIKCKNVSVIMDTDETSSIVINKVVVVLASGEESNITRAKEHLSSVLGLQTEVTVDDGKENG